MGKRKTISEVAERFMKSVVVTDGCWLWQGALNSIGHGVSSYKGKSIGAHRLSWIIKHGEITPDHNGHTWKKVVCHKCDNKNCVNPEHLYLGTHQTNATDLVRSGKNKGKNYDRRYKNEFGQLSATIYFDVEKKEDLELIDWLKQLPHGKFSETTKYFWDAKRQADEILRPIVEGEGK